MTVNKLKRCAPKLGAHLFSIAVITDTHVNPDEHECNSPFPVNRLANKRLRFVVDQLNNQDIDFVAHLGDLIHPVPSVPDLYGKAANAFHDLIKPLKHPIYFTPGNHDVGDKPINWGPTETVTDEFLGVWHQYFNHDYQSFEHNGIHFFIINNEIINSGLEQETKQKAWLEQELEKCTDQRIVMFTHYPLFLTFDDEDEHYDNMAEPGRSWLLQLIRKHHVEAIFAGHVHNFWYHRYHNSDYYILPATSFVRQDFSEMYRIEPGAEAGRNDAAKLGYAIVNFYQHGHTVNIVRTQGRQLTIDEAVDESQYLNIPIHPNEAHLNTPGIDLRLSWCEYSKIPPSGALDEFDRKTVRNDYPLLALWEMGIKKLRVPMADLTHTLTRKRMADLIQQGHEFTLFSYGIPTTKQIKLIAEHAELIKNWEIGYIEQELDQLITAIKELTGINFYFSPIKDVHDQTEGTTFYHTIKHGFSIGAENAISLLQQVGEKHAIEAGLVFRVRVGDQLTDQIDQIIMRANDLKSRVSIHILSSDPNPAVALTTTTQLEMGVKQLFNLASENPNTNFFIDIFADIDRGYFVRKGLVDRRYNPNYSSGLLLHHENIM